MRYKDSVRHFLAGCFSRETVLFSKFDDWEWPIRHEIEDFSQKEIPFFYKFSEIDLDLFDLIIPLTIDSEKYVNKHFAYLIGRKVITPSNTAIDLCDDKHRFAKFLINSGFGDFIPKINDNFAYPYLLKKKTGIWGKGINIIKDAADELRYTNEIGSRDYFRQEYVEGEDEYTTHIIMYDRKIVFYKTLQFTFHQRYFVKGINFKYSSRAEVDHEAHRYLFENILNKLGYQGICCINYKICNDKVKIFEINPRYGASMTCFVKEALASYRDILEKSKWRLPIRPAIEAPSCH
jgi:predicted ATP-grasp superfamily ATP-dependent carboligase